LQFAIEPFRHAPSAAKLCSGKPFPGNIGRRQCRRVLRLRLARHGPTCSLFGHKKEQEVASREKSARTQNRMRPHAFCQSCGLSAAARMVAGAADTSKTVGVTGTAI
jgi:hypothetical protein